MATAAVPEVRVRRRISTLLFVSLTAIATLVLLGLIVMGVRLLEIRAELGDLRDNALPRLVKLAQLSQEASATSSIAPALSTKPTRAEFDTLLSRIKDKQTSQRTLIRELGELFQDRKAAHILRQNSELLAANLAALTDMVRQQTEISQRLDDRDTLLRGLLADLSDGRASVVVLESVERDPAELYTAAVGGMASRIVFSIINALLDPNQARLSRNQHEIDAGMQNLVRTLEAGKTSVPGSANERLAAARRLVEYWSSEKEQVYADKRAELLNEFRIKALAEENSLIANRLLSSASNAFWRASNGLEAQIRLVNETARFTLATIFVVVLALGAGNFLVWDVLKRRVFRRLDRMREALRAYAECRDRALVDPVPDEIGEISSSLMHYMTVIDARETELAEKSKALEQLSNQLAKYLSPQVYDSIFTGKQDVKVASERKKLTVLFSDIVGFTETTERLESEELTQLLNQYLTEMSRIALDYGATIDKYVGDAIMIFFGDPETRGARADARACVEMAIAMQRRVRELAKVWRDAGIERPLACRIGINTGYCTVGNFGSEDRMDYTIVGNAVNLASRLEQAAPPGGILVSFETHALVKDAIHCAARGQIEVKGIGHPLAVYEAIGLPETMAGAPEQIREDRPHVRLDLDLAAMSDDERRATEELLHRALDRLASPPPCCAAKGATDPPPTDPPRRPGPRRSGPRSGRRPF